MAVLFCRQDDQLFLRKVPGLNVDKRAILFRKRGMFAHVRISHPSPGRITSRLVEKGTFKHQNFFTTAVGVLRIPG